MVKRRFFTFYAAKLLLFFEIRKKKEYFFLFLSPHCLIAFRLIASKPNTLKAINFCFVVWCVHLHVVLRESSHHIAFFFRFP